MIGPCNQRSECCNLKTDVGGEERRERGSCAWASEAPCAHAVHPLSTGHNPTNFLATPPNSLPPPPPSPAQDPQTAPFSPLGKCTSV
jgi:hypothetical protein